MKFRSAAASLCLAAAIVAAAIATVASIAVATAQEQTTKSPPAKAKAAVPANESPKDFMLRYSKLMDSLDLDTAIDGYHCADASQQKLAKAYCQTGIVECRVELAMRKQFGDEAAAKMTHAVHDRTDDDIKKAVIKVDGDKATVKYADDTEPSAQLVRVNGAWKYDTHFIVGAMSKAERENEIKVNAAIVRDAAPIIEKLEKGLYHNPDDAIRDMQHMMDQHYAGNLAEPAH